MRRIAIVGAGQSGLQLGLGLLDAGYETTLVSNRTPEEITTGEVLSRSQAVGSASRGRSNASGWGVPRSSRNMNATRKETK